MFRTFKKLRMMYRLLKKVKSMPNAGRGEDGTLHVDPMMIFTPEFMMQHSSYKSIEEMFEAEKIDISDTEALRDIPKERMDAITRSRTNFETFQEMYHAAIESFSAS